MASRAPHVLVALALVCGLLGAPQAHAEPVSTTVHVVESGDTLWQIAQDAGIDVPTLMRLNDLQDGDVLGIGQTLKLAAAVPAAPPAAASVSTPGKSYTVADGD